MTKLKIALWGPKTAEIWGPFSPDVLRSDRMVGGAETSLIHVSRGLAKMGHHVEVFHRLCEPGVYDGVRWRPAQEFNPRECFDSLILWDDSEPCRAQPCAHAVILGAHCNTQPHLHPEYHVDWLVAQSEWHRRALCQQYPNLSLEKSSVISNGVDLSRYDEKVERVPNRVIYCSSPDRGLHHLLRIWGKIREKIPGATLHCYYSMGGFERSKWRMDTYAATWWYVKTHLSQPGVFNHGGVGKQVLAREQMKASLMVYPSDLWQDGETFAGSVLECMAAGVPCLISDATALPEVYGEAAAILPRPIDDDQWVKAIVKLLTDEEQRKDYARRGLRFASTRDWARSATAWAKLVEERVRAAK